MTEGDGKMPKRKIDEFAEEREHLNDIVMQYAGRDIKRFYGNRLVL
jgi:hypothetical protein